MKFKLNVIERLMCLNLMPRQETYANMLLLQESKRDIGFDRKEHDELELEDLPNGGVKWNPEKGIKEKEIEIINFTLDKIKENLKKLNNDGKLEEAHMSLYKKLIKEE